MVSDVCGVPGDPGGVAGDVRDPEQLGDLYICQYDGPPREPCTPG